MQNASNPQQKSWWAKNPAQSLDDRVRQLNQISDPNTSADETLRWVGPLSWLSLAFTGFMCFFAYQSFFSRSLTPEWALVLSLIVVTLVEIVKKMATTKSLQVIFLMGPSYIRSSFGATMIFIAPLILGGVAFSLSVYNSTSAAEKYAAAQSRQRSETVFTPNTADIDAQIAALQETINKAPTYRWKKKEYYQSPKTVESASKSIADLNAQKSTREAQQRADYERNRDGSDAENAHAAAVIFKLGGWMEAIQLLLIIILVSCQKVLHERNVGGMITTSPTPQPQQRPIGFGNAQPAMGQQPTPPRTPVGFNYGAPPQPPATPGLTETDRGLTETQPASQEPASLMAFKQHRADFYRWRANLKNNDGARRTVCNHIAKALEGMFYHLPAVGDSDQYETKLQLLQFGQLDAELYAHYTVPHAETELNIYAIPFRAIWEKLKDLKA